MIRGSIQLTRKPFLDLYLKGIIYFIKQLTVKKSNFNYGVKTNYNKELMFKDTFYTKIICLMQDRFRIQIMY